MGAFTGSIGLRDSKKEKEKGYEDCRITSALEGKKEEDNTKRED